MVHLPKFKDGDSITENFISQSIDCFGHNVRLEKSTILNLINAAEDSFRLQPNLTGIDLKEGERITVCGDIHGQLFELLEIFKQSGNPSKDHLYLFNGDFSNHETNHIDVGEEFKKECLEKYDQELFDAFSNSFQVLPLAAVISKQYFVVHGGPSVDKDFVLDDIRATQRSNGESELVTQLLWNDLVMAEEKLKKPRGGGKLFDPTAISAFLGKEGLSKIIRSHEFTN